MSLRDQIVAAQDRPTRKVKVEVPEWGFSVWLRTLTIADQVALSEDVKPAEMPVKVLLQCIVDENGERVLTDEDEALLAGEDAPLVIRLFGEAAKLNGLSSKELEDAMAAFEPARDEQQSTDLPSPSGEPSENSKISLVQS